MEVVTFVDYQINDLTTKHRYRHHFVVDSTNIQRYFDSCIRLWRNFDNFNN